MGKRGHSVSSSSSDFRSDSSRDEKRHRSEKKREKKSKKDKSDKKEKKDKSDKKEKKDKHSKSSTKPATMSILSSAPKQVAPPPVVAAPPPSYAASIGKATPPPPPKAVDDFSHMVLPTTLAPVVLEKETEDDYAFQRSAGKALPTSVAQQSKPDDFSEYDDNIDIMWSDEDDEDDEAALAAFDELTARIKKQEAERKAVASTADNGVRQLLVEERAAAEAAAAAKETQLALSNNSFANSTGRGQLMVWADDEADAVDDVAMKLKIPEADKESKSKIKKMHYVNHSLIDYKPIQKDFYIAPSDVASLTEDELKKLYRELDGAQVRGKNCPRPMKTWVGIGLKNEIVQLLHQKGFTSPFAMQSLAMPVLMAGRDLLSIAKTGSGKTLSYALPLIRHVVNQPRPGKKRGPLALVLLPTQILAQQVFDVIKDFAIASGLKVVAAYGGVDLQSNIKQCIEGCDIMVATPGRLLDLCTSGSKGVVNLPDCSFVVIDEADRMFDAGFREHVTAFLKNCRPDKQLAFVSATMCKEVKVIIKSLLSPDFIELSTGGKPAPSTNVSQQFYFFDQEVYEADPSKQKMDKRLVRLAEILSDEWTSHVESNPNADNAASPFVPPLFLIFVDRKTDCDDLAVKLQQMGFRDKVGVLNSDYDAEEQHVIITRFNPQDRPILIATGSAERGLDVFGLDIVINYWMPDHYEAYVHRVGRTGRAGKRGRAFSFFIKGKDDPLADQLIEGLERTNNTVPEALIEAHLAHRERVKNGEYTGPSNYKKGFGSAKTFSFSSKHEKQQFRDSLKACGMGDYLSSDDSDSAEDSDAEVNTKFNDPDIVDVSDNNEGSSSASANGPASNALVEYKGGALTLSSANTAAIEAAKNFAAMTTAMHENATQVRYFQSDYVINNLPQYERYAVMGSKFLEELQERTNTTITKKGEYIDKRMSRGQKIAAGVKPLYLEVRGETRESITKVFRAFEEAQKEAKRKTNARLGGVNKNVQF